MNKLFTPFNFFIALIILILVFVLHLMYGHGQTSKYHNILQRYYMPDYLPNWMLKVNVLIPPEFRIAEPKYSGKWYAWYKSGAKELEFEYIDNVRIDKSKGWYEDGSVKFLCEFKEGTLTGKNISWYDNEKKKSEEENVGGKKNGKFTEWDANGKITLEQDWKDGVMIKDYLDTVKKSPLVNIEQGCFLDPVFPSIIIDFSRFPN